MRAFRGAVAYACDSARARDRFLEAERAPVAGAGVQRVNAAACAGALEELRLKPGFDRPVGVNLAAAVSGCRTDEARGSQDVAPDGGDGCQSQEALEGQGSTTSSRQKASSSRNVSLAASASPVSGLASPNTPRRSIQM